MIDGVEVLTLNERITVKSGPDYTKTWFCFV